MVTGPIAFNLLYWRRCVLPPSETPRLYVKAPGYRLQAHLLVRGGANTDGKTTAPDGCKDLVWHVQFTRGRDLKFDSHSVSPDLTPGQISPPSRTLLLLLATKT